MNTADDPLDCANDFQDGDVVMIRNLETGGIWLATPVRAEDENGLPVLRFVPLTEPAHTDS